MACKYELQKNPTAAPKGDKYYHARPKNNRKCDLDEICREVARGNMLSEPQIKATTQEVIHAIMLHLSEGENVNINGLGEFQITLSCPATRHPEEIRAGSIDVKSVKYKPSKKLVDNLKLRTTFERTHANTTTIDKSESLLPTIIEYFQNPENGGKAITSRYLHFKLRITIQKASDMLHELVTKGYLLNPSTDVHHPMYIKGERLNELMK